MVRVKQLRNIIYQLTQTNSKISVIIKDEDLWATQKTMAALFGCSSDNVSLHLQNIFKEGELDKKSTAEFFSVVQNEGQREVKRNVEHYNLSAIIRA